MKMHFAETIRKIRGENGLSQRELAERVFVTRTTIAKWENGARLPDAVMISRLAKCLSIDVNTLLSAATESDESPNVIMVDDRKIILTGGFRFWKKPCRTPRSPALPARQKPLNMLKLIVLRWLFSILRWEKQPALTFAISY